MSTIFTAVFVFKSDAFSAFFSFSWFDFCTAMVWAHPITALRATSGVNVLKYASSCRYGGLASFGNMTPHSKQFKT